ncbi:pilus assembly protein TadG-related protein [Ammonifex thiophilus]|uniref:Putative Flp pilus-assembly TadG-like N-terminal domain-containing protein n=1 Tax=Ammonifex thiophilus TaxID=444093 RepID=A0A3D8P2B6_9THEO|nr:pilus assembly protein TadG-related protein [Ammonifex thiophilus]RDV82347.1 hypothetical protein DXX99_08010 [Ammonifex thiophilus]
MGLLVVFALALFCALGVLGLDVSRAVGARARLRTALDAAALAACKQAALVPEYRYTLLDGDGNETTDPSKAAVVRAEVVGFHCDLAGRDAQALAQARAAFGQNLSGGRDPLRDAREVSFSGGVRYDRPKTGKDGSTYYDEYRTEGSLAVRSYLLAGPLARWLAGGLVREGSPGGQGEEWAGYIVVSAEGTAQALPPPPPAAGAAAP